MGPLSVLWWPGEEPGATAREPRWEPVSEAMMEPRAPLEVDGLRWVVVVADGMRAGLGGAGVGQGEGAVLGDGVGEDGGGERGVGGLGLLEGLGRGGVEGGGWGSVQRKGRVPREGRIWGKGWERRGRGRGSWRG